MLRSNHCNDLEEVYELNRLFLDFLCQHARAQDDCLGLDGPTVALLESLTLARLEDVAQFPRALFQLSLGRVGPPRRFDAGASPGERSHQSLQLTILHCAWNMSRRSNYGARLFLALEDQEVRALRTTPLSALPTLSASGELITCGFLGARWFWQQLLTETRAEFRRRLLLIGLQPDLQVSLGGLARSGQQASA